MTNLTDQRDHVTPWVDGWVLMFYLFTLLGMKKKIIRKHKTAKNYPRLW